MAIKTYKDTTASASVVNDSDVLVIQQGENNTLTEMKQTTVEALKEDLVRKEVGKGLSANDYSGAEKAKVTANTAARHTHSNKALLDGLSQNDVTTWNAAQPNEIETITVNSGSPLTITNKNVNLTIPEDASALPYDNAGSALSSSNTQDAIDELSDEKINIASIVDNLTTDNSELPLSAKQGKNLNEGKVDKTTTVNTKPLSGNVVLAAVDIGSAETTGISATNVQDAIDELASEKIDKANIATNLTTDDNTKVLSAKQGKILDEDKISYSDIVNNLTTGGTDVPLSAEQGKNLNDSKVEKTTTINSKPLSGNVVLAAGDIGFTATTEITSTNVQTAINETYTELDSAKIDKTSIVNDLITGGTTSVLSAEQGKILNESKVETSRTINTHPLSSDVTITKADVGLGDVDNTSDADKPISTETQTALNAKAATTYVDAADDDLQGQIDNLVSGSKVIGVFENIATRDEYTTLHTPNLNDIVKVLSDSSPYAGKTTYYKWLGEQGERDWVYQLSEAERYTITETDDLLDEKADKSTTYTKTDVDDKLAGKVPTTRTINGYDLSANRTLASSDIGYNNATSGLTASQVQAALDELVVNLGSSDSAISALGGRLDTLEAGDTTEGSVAKSIKDAVKPIVGENWDGTTLKEVDDHANTLQDQVDALSAGGPKGVYDTLVDLQTADPDHAFIYVVKADGNWYFWNITSSDWASGGVYNDSAAFDSLAGAGRTTETVKQNADAIDAIKGAGYTEGTLKTHEDRLDTLEGADTVAGSVTKTVKDAVDPIESRLDSTELTLARTNQDLASVKQTLQQGNGATLDFSGIGSVALDARATGRANPTVEGLTATQLISNGDFSDGTTGWSVSNGVVITANERTLSVETIKPTNGSSTYVSLDKTHYYYLSVLGSLVTGAGDIRLRARVDATNTSIKDTTPVSSFGYNLHHMVLTPTDLSHITDGITFYMRNSEPATSHWKEAKIIDLTQTFGAGNEPSEADCAKIFSYFDGTKSIQLPARLRSVGKNFLNYANAIDGRYINIDIGTVVTVSGRSYDPTFYAIPVGTTHIGRRRIESTSQFIIVLHFYDSQKNWLASYIMTSADTTITSVPVGAKYVRIASTANKDAVLNTYLSACYFLTNTVVPPYEPYTDSTLYIADNEELRSVPAIADEVKVVNGELVKVQNVQRYVFQASDISDFVTIRVNLDSVDIKKPLDGIFYSNQFGHIGSVIMQSYNQVGSILDTLDYVNTFTAVYSPTNFRLFFPKGTYANLATAQADLAGTIIYYQLATPITTSLTTSGILQAKPNGTVYYEPYYEGSHQTNASSQITLPYEGTIEAVYGYDENFEPYEVPSTGYTLVGTTLTVTGAEENEVFYVQMSRSEGLAPEMSVNVLNNDRVLLNPTNGKFYDYTIGVRGADGALIPEFIFTEVE